MGGKSLGCEWMLLADSDSYAIRRLNTNLSNYLTNIDYENRDVIACVRRLVYRYCVARLEYGKLRKYTLWMFIRRRLQLSQDIGDDRFRSRSEHKVIRNLNFRIDLLTIAEAYTVCHDTRESERRNSRKEGPTLAPRRTLAAPQPTLATTRIKPMADTET